MDLAGSERSIDSMFHDADQRKEGAQINASLMALKQVVRERVAGTDSSLSYRKSKLTQLLKTSLCIPDARCGGGVELLLFCESRLCCREFGTVEPWVQPLSLCLDWLCLSPTQDRCDCDCLPVQQGHRALAR